MELPNDSFLRDLLQDEESLFYYDIVSDCDYQNIDTTSLKFKILMSTIWGIAKNLNILNYRDLKSKIGEGNLFKYIKFNSTSNDIDDGESLLLAEDIQRDISIKLKSFITRNQNLMEEEKFEELLNNAFFELDWKDAFQLKDMLIAIGIPEEKLL